MLRQNDSTRAQRTRSRSGMGTFIVEPGMPCAGFLFGARPPFSRSPGRDRWSFMWTDPLTHYLSLKLSLAAGGNALTTLV